MVSRFFEEVGSAWSAWDLRFAAQALAGPGPVPEQVVVAEAGGVGEGFAALDAQPGGCPFTLLEALAGDVHAGGGSGTVTFFQ